MADHVHIHIGCYRITFPDDSNIEVFTTKRNKKIQDQSIYTFWKITCDRFFFLIHLTTTELSDLKIEIENTTKSSENPEGVLVNQVTGVTIGNYNSERTWIDWRFKKGDQCIAINLQPVKFPQSMPKEEEKKLHNQIINSLIYLGK